MTWHINRGTPPRDKTVKLAIQWACGLIDKDTFAAPQLRWSLTGHPFDIGKYARAAN